ncbi:MAG: Flp family type IVb pilin [Terracidiphilus sp.]
MNGTLLLKLYVKFRNLRDGEEGQDLVEYTLLLCMISLALVTTLGNIATTLSGFFTVAAGKF